MSAANLIKYECVMICQMCAKLTIVFDFFSMCEYPPEKFRNFGQIRKVMHQNLEI